MGAVVELVRLDDAQWVYEPKYDGIRVKTVILPGSGSNGVHISSRHGTGMTPQFPDLVQALDRFRKRLENPILTDGEIVAIDHGGKILSIQALQGRIGLARPRAADLRRIPVALIQFDILLENGEDLHAQPLLTGRQRLERLFRSFDSPFITVSRFAVGDGRPLYDDATKEGWEGLMAKRANSPYRSDQHHADWRRIKLLLQQEFVVGGWTESTSRPFRALLLGVYTEMGALEYVGRMGKVFSDEELRTLFERLSALEISTCPFRQKPDPEATPHWMKPELVIQAKFNQWTRSGKLREPTYVGLRIDVDPKTVRREPVIRITGREPDARRQTTKRRSARTGPFEAPDEAAALLRQLEAILQQRQQCTLRLPTGSQLAVNALHKPMWPMLRITKAGLMAYYIAMAPYILPAMADRPLTYRRYPHGAGGRPDRYHQRVKHAVPEGVRVATLKGSQKAYETRFIGGSLITLLYLVQLNVISMDA
jgi:bifunctional non-homologous end joining protein LigD